MKVRTVLTLVLALGLLTAGIAYGPRLVGRVAYAIEAGQVEAARAELAELAKHDHLSGLFEAVSKAVKPAVVEVRVRQKITARPAPQMDEFLRRFFGDDIPGLEPAPQPRRQPREYYRSGLGSGVIIDAENGYILTNNHVVGQADEVEVVLADKRTFKAQWVRTDPPTDLAVVKIEPDRLIDAPLADSATLKVGHWVLAIGSPEGLPQTVTAGIVSATGRVTGRGGYENFIQTDAAINHGNSGGPLVNMRGEVVGINTAIVSRTGVNEGIGLSIPSNMARDILDQLVEGGKVVRGYLGVRIQNVDEDLAESFDLPNTRGALVAEVSPDSPADEGGIKAGDFIVAVDGKRVDSVNELRNAVAAIDPDEEVEIELYRDGEKRTRTVRLGEQPADMLRAFRDGDGRERDGDGPSELERYGIEVADLNERLAEQLGYEDDRRGVVIVDVRAGTDAARAGLARGMLILEVNGKEVESVDGLKEIVDDAEDAAGLRLRVATPDGGRRYVFVTPSEN